MNVLNIIKKDRKDNILNIRKIVSNNIDKGENKHDGQLPTVHL